MGSNKLNWTELKERRKKERNGKERK